jgi:hypothetical protein
MDILKFTLFHNLLKLQVMIDETSLLVVTGVHCWYCFDFVNFSTNQNMLLQHVMKMCVNLGVCRVFLNKLEKKKMHK